MKKNVILAQSEKIGNIQRCCNGVVHIHCKGISLRFTEDTFLDFASMIKKAFFCLIDEGLSELMEEQN